MKKVYTTITLLLLTTLSIAQVELTLSKEDKGFPNSIQPFGAGYVVDQNATIYNDVSKGFCLSYFDEDGNLQWKKKFDRKIWGVDFLVGDNLIYDIVYPYSDVPFQVSVINREGEIKSSGDKLTTIFADKFDNFKDINMVGEGDYSFLIGDDLYILFSHKVKDLSEYYICKIDEDFEVETHKLNMSSNWKDVFYKKGADLKLVEIDNDKIYFSQAYKTEESYSFSLFEVNLLTFEEVTIIDKIELQKNKIIGDKGFLNETHPGAFHPEGVNFNSSIDYRSDVSRGQTWGQTNGQTMVFSPSIDARYSCKRIENKWYFFGVHYDLKPFTTKYGSGNQIIGTWTMMVDLKGESTVSASNCFATLDRKKFGSIQNLNLYMSEDNELCFLTKIYGGDMYLSYLENSKISAVSQDFIESNINPMVALALAKNEYSYNTQIARRDNKVFVFRLLKNPDKKTDDLTWKLQVY